MDIDIKNENQFMHFDSINECDNFILYANKIGIKIGHRCCSNIGCCIIEKSIDINDLKNNFELIMCKDVKKDECPICFEILFLSIKCNRCNNLLCKPCGKQINKCPFCRTKL